MKNNKIGTAYFLAKKIQENKITYESVMVKYPELKDSINTIIEEMNVNLSNK